jgi:phosphatidylinositol alpha-1,6-mannosyltransferase
MGAGLPVVGFDTGWPDLIRKVGHGKLVAIRDVAAFAAAVSEILALPDHGRGLGAAGRVYALEHLGVRSSVDLLTATYKRRAGLDAATR